jgi:Uma2 family endonuclease
MSTYPRYTSRDLEMMPDIEGVRYELIDGELHVSKQPSWEHQFAASAICGSLHSWSQQSRTGWAVQVPGLVFSGDDDVVPDVIWISHQRRRAGRDAAGHLTIGPELAVEVISPGAANERRGPRAAVRPGVSAAGSHAPAGRDALG